MSNADTQKRRHFSARPENGQEHPTCPGMIYLALRGEGGHTITGYVTQADHAWIVSQLCGGQCVREPSAAEQAQMGVSLDTRDHEARS